MKLGDFPAKDFVMDMEPRKGLKRYPFARYRLLGKRYKRKARFFAAFPGWRRKKCAQIHSLNDVSGLLRF
jgi:hypothetical protein